ncbi:hypothetical protein [Hydrocarboniphaga sp.]|uniref:hypothetical protein n=1 Tax=Hydrocarboniphaga sp. TaxID=2033016 RepID=UPI003D0C0DFE
MHATPEVSPMMEPVVSSDDAPAPRASLRPWQTGTAGGMPLSVRLSIALARARRWEFWPTWLYYGPIVVWILWLGLRHRSATVFTAANPVLDNGGVVGERKHQALAPLQRNAPDLAATFVLVDAIESRARLNAAVAFVARPGIGWPLVLKPDVGQRGRGVFIARNVEAARDYLERFDGNVIAQRYVAGEEFGIFIARMPGAAEVQVLSIVHKTFPAVTGDGSRRLRELILDDARARLISQTLFARWAQQLDQVPAAGQRITLVEIGSHCRGSLFLDAGALCTPALIATLTRLADAVPGYCFGRLDLRAPSADHLQRGVGLQVMELNGVTAESAHIYQPGTPLIDGYRAMFRQWSLAFAIGRANASRGAKVTSPMDLLRLFLADRQRDTKWF